MNLSQQQVFNSAEETQKFAKEFAKEILKKPRKEAVILALCGELGAGKTTFLQGFGKGLEIKEKILSPTFNILKRFGNFYHFDCYRIDKPEEILELGWKEIIADPKNIVAVEWPEKIQKYLPKNIIKLEFKSDPKNPNQRTLTIGS